MEKISENANAGRTVWVVKALMTAYLTTIVMLLLLAFGLYKFDLSEQIVQGGITVIYVLSAFIGGRVAGKMAKNRRFLWGIIVGLSYFALLVIISLLIYRSSLGGNDLVFSGLFCLLGGMLGGMFS